MSRFCTEQLAKLLQILILSKAHYFAKVLKQGLVGLVLLVGIFVTVSLVFFAQPVVAQTPLGEVCRDTPQAEICRDNDPQSHERNALYGPDGILTKVANILSIVVGVVSIFVILIGGIRFVLSGGDPSKVNSAKNNIIYALIGLIVAASAQAIIIFVLNRL